MTRRTGPSQQVRDRVFGRDGMACVMCSGTYPLTLQHRRARGMGGTRRADTNGMAALIVLCGSGTTGCHGWTEANPTLALERGYRVAQHQTPADVPLVWHGAWVLLTDDGAVHHLPMPDVRPADVEDDQAVRDYLRGAS